MAIEKKSKTSPESIVREIKRKTRRKFTAEEKIRILKSFDLVTSPVYTVVSAKDRFENPTTRINQLWQTDFCYLKVIDFTQ